jgi:hypothetical protein
MVQKLQLHSGATNFDYEKGRNFEGQGGHSLDEETKWKFSKPITQLATCF